MNERCRFISRRGSGQTPLTLDGSWPHAISAPDSAPIKPRTPEALFPAVWGRLSRLIYRLESASEPTKLSQLTACSCFAYKLHVWVTARGTNRLPPNIFLCKPCSELDATPREIQ